MQGLTSPVKPTDMESNPDQLLDALRYIDPTCPREEWVRIGMGMHAGGLTLNDWLAWSAGGANYSKQDAISTWRSFHRKTNGITPSTVFRIALDNGWTPDEDGRDRPVVVRRASDDMVGFSTHNEAPPWLVEDEKAPYDPHELWEAGVDPFGHWYVTEKHIPSSWVRVYPGSLRIAKHTLHNPLLVPATSIYGGLTSLQVVAGSREESERLKADGKPNKLNLPRVPMKDGCLMPVHPYECHSVVFVVEGVGQAAALNSLGYATCSAFGLSRMGMVAEELSAVFPSAMICVLPDAGAHVVSDRVWVAQMTTMYPNNTDIHDVMMQDRMRAQELADQWARETEFFYHEVLSNGE